LSPATNVGRPSQRDLEEKILVLEKWVSKLSGELSHLKLRSEAKNRLAWAAIGFLLTEAAVMYGAYLFGEGANLWQHLVRSWPALALPLPVWTLASRFLLGPNRIGALGWPLKRFFGAATSEKETQDTTEREDQ
jgi:hypothetical protein